MRETEVERLHLALFHLLETFFLRVRIGIFRARFSPRGFLDADPCTVYAACMSTKTISVSLPAYERLRQARCKPEESFSHVILRAEWRGDTVTADQLLLEISRTPPCYVSREIDQVEDAKRVAEIPVDKWPSN